jgi:hypothetical protein
MHQISSISFLSFIITIYKSDILTLLMIQDVCFWGIAALNIYNKQLSIPFSPRMICSIEPSLAIVQIK